VWAAHPSSTPWSLNGDLEKRVPWHFSLREDENVVFVCLHFPSLDVIENGGASVRRAGTSIIRAALMSF
jgi:hypothetical protein